MKHLVVCGSEGFSRPGVKSTPLVCVKSHAEAREFVRHFRRLRLFTFYEVVGVS